MARRPKSDRVPGWISQHVPEELAESTAFRFKITLPNGNRVSVDLKPDVEVDYDHLERQLEDVPSQYIYWMALYSEMKAHASTVERRIKARRGVLVEEATQVKDENRFKLTGDQVKQVVEADENLNELEQSLIMLQKHVGKLYHMGVALQMKSEHLRSLAGFKRHERKQAGRQT